MTPEKMTELFKNIPDPAESFIAVDKAIKEGKPVRSCYQCGAGLLFDWPADYCDRCRPVRQTQPSPKECQLCGHEIASDEMLFCPHGKKSSKDEVKESTVEGVLKAAELIINARPEPNETGEPTAAEIHLNLTLCDLRLWIEWHLRSLKSRNTSHPTEPNQANGYAYAEIPDWELRQKLENISKCLTK